MPVDPYTPALYGFFYGDALYGTDLNPEPLECDTDETSDAVFDGDALFFATGDGGEMCWRQGEPLRSGGLRNAYYLSWFGGNHTDSGLPDDRKTWWGNTLEADTAPQYRGQLERYMNENALTSATLPVAESIALDDVAWALETGVADSHEISITITAPDRVRIDVSVTANGNQETFSFFENWNAKS